jgi:iron only hydrogenase large subunit-like protein
MNELIIVNPDKCVGCNACIRTCRAPEANITKLIKDDNGNVVRSVTTVNPEKCIACGECVKNCSHGARDYVDDTLDVMNAIYNQKENFIVLAAPTIKSVYPTKWKGILQWFKDRGCLVYDVSFGADICTWAHLKFIQQNKINSIITQPCAAIVNYIETYQPSLIRNLSPVHSPILCTAVYVKKYMRRNKRMVALTPCIAKKKEFLETGLVDYNVTFNKLMEFFEKNGESISSNFSEDFRYDFEGTQGQMGAIYPRIGGLRDNLWLRDPDINITTSEGVHMVYPDLDKYAKLSDNKKPEVFDVLSCDNGCTAGAGTGKKHNKFDINATMHEVEKEAKSRRKTSGGIFRGAEDKLFKEFDNELNVNDFMRQYTAAVPSPIPSIQVLEPVFESMGKHTEYERNIDCNACGYHSCREMAIAISRGLNVPENCIVHAKSALMKQKSELQTRHAALEDMREQVSALSERLNGDINTISEKMGAIRTTNGKTVDRAKDVKNLMTQLREFGENFKELSDDDISDVKSIMSQLVEVMDAVLGAFEGVDEFVSVSDTETSAVDAQIDNMKQLVQEINSVLNERAKTIE